MKIDDGDIWKAHAAGWPVAVTTNGEINVGSKAIMGRGTAKDAATRYPALPKKLGARIRDFGNHVFFFPEEHLYTFPVKHHWRDPADLALIRQSALEIAEISRGLGQWKVVLPRPGCGNGNLAWSAVEPILAAILDDRFTIVNLAPTLLRQDTSASTGDRAEGDALPCGNSPGR